MPFSTMKEIVDLLKSAQEFYAAASELVKRKNSRLPYILDALKDIYFPSDGLLQILRRYLESGETRELLALQDQLNASNERVVSAKKTLVVYRMYVENASLKDALFLEEIHQAKYGPRGIRPALERLILAFPFDQIDDSELMENVRSIVGAIESFNGSIAELHDRLLERQRQ